MEEAWERSNKSYEGVLRKKELGVIGRRFERERISRK